VHLTRAGGQVGLHDDRLDCRLERQDFVVIQRHIVFADDEVVQFERPVEDDVARDEAAQLVHVSRGELFDAQPGVVHVLQQRLISRNQHR